MAHLARCYEVVHFSEIIRFDALIECAESYGLNGLVKRECGQILRGVCSETWCLPFERSTPASVLGVWRLQPATPDEGYASKFRRGH